GGETLLLHDSMLPGQASGSMQEELQNLLLEHAWLKENSDRRIHPVATRNPFLFDDKKIYDLVGNITELVWKDPGVPRMASGHYVRALESSAGVLMGVGGHIWSPAW